MMAPKVDTSANIAFLIFFIAYHVDFFALCMSTCKLFDIYSFFANKNLRLSLGLLHNP